MLLAGGVLYFGAHFSYQTCLHLPLCHMTPRGMMWSSYRAASPIKLFPCQFTGLELGAETSQGLPLCLRADPHPWSLGEGFLAAPCRYYAHVGLSTLVMVRKLPVLRLFQMPLSGMSCLPSELAVFSAHSTEVLESEWSH